MPQIGLPHVPDGPEMNWEQAMPETSDEITAALDALDEYHKKGGKTLAEVKAELASEEPMPEASDELAFAALRRANETRQSEWDKEGGISLSYRGNELAGETGEACNIIKKLERERLGIRGSRATVANLADELSDIIICVDLIAMHESIDLGAAVVTKFNATSEKYSLSTRLREAAPAAPAGWSVRGAEAYRLFADENEAREFAGKWGIVKPVYEAREAAPANGAIPMGWSLISDRHFNALAAALAEIKATSDGESDQPIKDIVAWCLSEIEASKAPVQGFAAPAEEVGALVEMLKGRIWFHRYPQDEPDHLYPSDIPLEAAAALSRLQAAATKSAFWEEHYGNSAEQLRIDLEAAERRVADLRAMLLRVHNFIANTPWDSDTIDEVANLDSDICAAMEPEPDFARATLADTAGRAK